MKLAPVIVPALRLLHATAFTLEMSRRCAVTYRRTRRHEDAMHWVHAWADRFGPRFGIEVDSDGGQNVDWEKPLIVMANHQSYLDIFALCRALPRIYGMVAKKELARIPYFGDTLEATGCVIVDRRNRRQAVTAMQAAADEIRGGKSIVVFPEGTRGPPHVIQRLKRGGLHLAQTARVPIIPVGIVGTAELMPRTNTALHPGRVAAHIGDPIPPPGDDSAKARDALGDRVRAELSRLTGFPLA